MALSGSLFGAVAFGAGAAGSTFMNPETHEMHATHIVQEQIKKVKNRPAQRRFTTGEGRFGRAASRAPRATTEEQGQQEQEQGQQEQEQGQQEQEQPEQKQPEQEQEQPEQKQKPEQTHTSTGPTGFVSSGQEQHTFGLQDKEIERSARLQSSAIRIPPVTKKSPLYSDGGRVPTAVGDIEDGTRDTNGVRLVQVAHASYIRELNKYNTVF